MIVISVKHDFDRLIATSTQLARTQLPYATSRALNDAAQSAAATMDADMPQIFHKATRFTRNAVVAPKSLSARKDRLMAIVAVRDIQAKYLLHEQEGGTRTPGENTRRPDAKALVVPGPKMKLNSFGNIPNGALQRLTAQLQANASAATANRHAAKAKAGKRIRAVANRDRGVFYVPPNGNRLAGGFWLRLPGHRITHLIAFTPTERYKPKFDYGGRVIRAARATFAASIGPRLAEAMADAIPK